MKSNSFKGRQTIFAEGCRGHLGKKLIEKFNLYENNQFQTYAIGLKELWEVNNNTLNKGDVFHSIGWPLYNNAYGGSLYISYQIPFINRFCCRIRL